jgi:uncharacterized damage-inducible protein DinB
MTWIAPQTTRLEPLPLGDERALLETLLDFHRQTLLRKCAGLTPEQFAERATPPSGLTLLGLVRHMTEVERAWFRRMLAGESIDFQYRDAGTNPKGDFNDFAAAHAERDYDAFVREIEAARATTAGRSLDETFWYDRKQTHMSLRALYLHMIQEYARHNGHADLIRERIDGATGH